MIPTNKQTNKQTKAPTATDWLDKGRAMCYLIHVIMHVKDSQLFVVREGHVLNSDVNMIQTKQAKGTTKGKTRIYISILFNVL